ncbi:unnamed protein product [Protopolystoma xenopodis]|uniref:DNA-directed RNA polymerase n=1 Tax=Protopolystoma xenopodis TaxID=117903 RepID=A0A448X008_9PLAT|nr:unnamed protein product [Protopolystoma xenopodis]
MLCRRQGKSYSGSLNIRIIVRKNGVSQGIIEATCSDIPIMVLSRACNLSKIPRSTFPAHNEEEQEIGGYFIAHGKERVIRLIIVIRRNYVSCYVVLFQPIALSRKSFKKRGDGYTEHGILMRCVRDDEVSSVRT